MALQQETFPENLIVERDNYLAHFFSHSKIKANTKEDLLELLAEERNKLLHLISKQGSLFITLGSMWAYQLGNKTIVANCHKQDQQGFSKILLDEQKVFWQGEQVLQDLLFRFPKLQVVLTVSPVKHLKDGVIENKLSKALLRVLCHKWEKAFKSVHYLPVLEWVEEDLRDHQFYQSDKAHPNPLAEDYVWQQFSGHCLKA
ncbi:MAG: GSCFA domain-containing protein [Luteibaculum sp.]